MFDLISEKIVKENLPKNIIQPRRAQIYVGFQCHQKCGFCYYKFHCNDKMFDFSKIQKQIDFEYAYGIREFEITGGEPSEYNDLRYICQYIKSIDSKNKIAIITNGGLWSSNVWDLIDEVLISYHLGKNDVDYNKEIFPLGNTCSKVLKTIEKTRKHNILLRTNTVLGTFNLNNIDYILSDLIEFNPDIINFLPVNIFDEAKNMEKYIDYNILRTKLKYSIDKITSTINSKIYVRYMPFCQMEGYEKYIVGTLQHIYDKHDWNRELDGINILKMIESPNYFLKQLGNYGSTSIQTAINTRKNTYCKSKECLTCKYNIICDGVEQTLNNKLQKYIFKSNGKIIKNILYFLL